MACVSAHHASPGGTVAARARRDASVWRYYRRALFGAIWRGCMGGGASVGSDARFRSLHSIGVGPWRRPYKALDVDFSHPHVVAPGWEGVIVRCEYPFRFLALDGVEVVKE